MTTLAERPSKEFPIPTGREEAWRFTPLKRMSPVLDDGLPSGRFHVSLSDKAPATVTLSDEGELGGGVYQPVDRAAQQVWRGRSSSQTLKIAAESVAGEPISVNVSAKDGVAYGHLTIEVGAHARASVLLNFDQSAQGGLNLQIRLDNGANLTLVQVHDQDRRHLFVSDQEFELGQDANLLSMVVLLGGDLVRLTPSVRFAAPGGRAEMLGLYLTGAGQHHENRVLIDHATPKCVSDVLYNGALYGSQARSVWVGDVVVRATAEGIDTYEKNQNLLLVDDARADSIPNLELETGEVVRAGHASTTGKLDEEQIFYLMARGVSELEARALIVRGLFASVLQRIDDEAVADLVLSRLDEAFATAGSTSAVLRGGGNG